MPVDALNNSETYGVEDGLYHGNVNSFLINHQGFMWISSDDGLHRFDGYNFLNYAPSPVNNLLRHEVNLLFEDNNGDLWMGYFVDGLARFSIQEARFYNYLHDEDVKISHVVYDEARNRIWVSTTKGLYLHHPEEKQFVPVASKNESLDDHVLAMCTDTAGNVWLGTPSGLSVFNPEEHIFHNYTTDPDDSSTISMNHVLSLHCDRKGTVWAGTQWGINRVYIPKDGDIGQLTFERIMPRSGDNKYNFTFQKEHIEEQYQNIVALSEIGKQITSSLEIDEVIRNIHQIINKLMDAGWLSIGLLDEKSEVINFRFLEPDSNSLKEDHIALKEDSRISVYAVKNKKVLLINDLQREFVQYVDSASEIYPGMVNSAVYLPLITSKSSVVGIMILKSKERNAYSQINLDVLKSIAAYSTIACENAVMYDRLQLQSKQLKEADYIKTRFFINMSHELKTPLTLIRSPLQSLKKLSNQPEADKLADLVIKNTDRLGNLINQLLDIRKIENGTKNIELINGDLAAFLKQIVDLFSEAANEKNIKLKFTCSQKSNFLAWFDKDVIGKIVNNLLSNAIKYTPRDESVTVKAGCSEEHFIEIHVTNSGVGIPREKISEIFHRFYHYSPLKEEMGTGIGLSYVKDLVDLYHGKISVESPGNKFTRFSVKIPANPEQLPEAVVMDDNMAVSGNNDKADRTSSPIMAPDAGKEPEEDQNEKYRVLIIEDNADLCEYLVSELKCYYQVLTASDGKEGLDVAKDSIPDLIISDVMMPLMNGLELAEALKSDILTSHIPVILLTALSDNTEQVAGLHTGADDYVTKPFNLEVLKARISTLLQNRKMLAESILSPGGLKKNSVNKMDRDFIERCRNLVRNNFFNPEYDYEAFFNDLNMSRANCYRKIKALTGKSIGEYINVEKMNYAAETITSGTRNITQLPYDMGYNTPSNFTRDLRRCLIKRPVIFFKQRIKAIIVPKPHDNQYQ